MIRVVNGGGAIVVVVVDMVVVIVTRGRQGIVDDRVRTELMIIM